MGILFYRKKQGRPAGSGRGSVSVFRRGRGRIGRTIYSLAAVTGSLVLITAGCGMGARVDENERFEEYTMEVFRREAAGDTITLHYTLKDPEQYGIQEPEVSFGEFNTDPQAVRAAAENICAALLGFDFSSLDTGNRITYEILNYYQRALAAGADYLLYEEPLRLTGGVQTQLPVILSEYSFYDRDDVEIYLELMKTTGEYFDSLIAFEQKKGAAGLFMGDSVLDAVLDQCSGFLGMKEENYLYSTFVERIGEVDGLTEEEKSDYIQENALIIEDYVIPAYEKLAAFLEDMRGTGKNEEGLCQLPGGQEYYETALALSVGTGRTVRELKDLARSQISDDLTAMERVLGISEGEAAETAASVITDRPEDILDFLKRGIGNAFPEAPETELRIKYVPEAMEEHLSPAFYMIPEIDNMQENVIYINQLHLDDPIALFTTLAHEGYPGHLYQTTYFEQTDPDPLRSIFGFGGYVEGWATYGEMCSYYLTPLTSEQQILLQKNSSIILGLYALADMGVHYDGWDRTDLAAFFSNYGFTDQETADQIYEWIIGAPGNYLKYYIGYVEFLELKKDWAEEKGEDFSQKEFHEAVLGVGPAPFEIVEKYMYEVE